METRKRCLRRERKLLPTHLEKVSLNGKFSGYASVFGDVDQGRDAVTKGAFSKSLLVRPAPSIRMLFQHNPDEPIGVWNRISEDEKGLFVEGQLATGTRRGMEMLELMRSGAIDGLSIGFKTKRARKDPRTQVRWIHEADLWEISIVTFPLLESARITSLKAKMYDAKPSVRHFERWLTRDAGLSRADARTVISDSYAALACKQDAARRTPLAETIRDATQRINMRNR